MASSLSRARKTGAAAGLIALAALFGAAPASAHDALAYSSPAAGQTITSNPGEVSITLTNPPNMATEGASVLTVTAPDGHVVSSGEITVDGATLSTAADIDHEGTHTVEWQALSADGHPIEGNFSFTFASEAQSSPAVTEAAANTAPPTSEPSAEATPETDQASETEAWNTAWMIAAGAAVMVAVLGILFYLTRRRNKGRNQA